MIAPHPENEHERVEALRRYEILDTEPEAPFDDLVQLAAQACQVPIALISLIDPLRQWFKAKTGVGVCQTSRDIAFCVHAILQRDIFEVPDALGDERFATNPLVTGEPHIRFYAGVPLVDRENYALGTLCLIDRVPRRLSWQQKQTLTVLGRQVVAHLELRLRNRQLTQRLANGEQVEAMRAKCLFALDHTHSAIAFLDHTGRYTYVTCAHAAIYGYEAAELIGKSWKDFHTAPCIETLDTKVFPLLLKEGRWTGDIAGRQKNGNPLAANVSLAVFPGSAQSSDWLLWICHDPKTPPAAAVVPAARPVPEPLPAPSPAQPKPSQPPRLRILLVEDMEDNRVLVSVFLKALPYQLELAEHGAAGVETFQSGHFDLVLMDIQMPVMDGYEAIRLIRLWEETQQRGTTPIIALTGNTREEDMEKTRAAGFTAHVTKPLKKHTLLEAIQRYAVNPSLKELAS